MEYPQAISQPSHPTIRLQPELVRTVIGFVIVSLTSILAVGGQATWPVLVAMAGALSVLIVGYPIVGLTVSLLGISLFERFFTLTPFIFNEIRYPLYPVDMVLGITAAAVLLQTQPGKLLRRSPWGKAHIAWLAVIGLAGLVAWRGGLGNAEIVGSAVKNLGVYSLVGLLTFVTVRRWQEARLLVNSLVAGGVMIVGFIMYGLIHGQGLWAEATPLSTYGTRYLAATHAFFLIPVILITVSLLMAGRRVFGQLTIPLLAIWSVGIGLSLLRNLWLGLTVGVAILLIAAGRGLRRRAVPAALIIVGLLCTAVFLMLWVRGLTTSSGTASDVLYPLTSRIEQFVTLHPTDSSSQWRFDAWSKSLALWQRTPLLGIGLGTTYTIDILGLPQQLAARDLHNDYVAILLQMGLIGLAAFVWFAIKVLVVSWQAALSATGEQRAIGIALATFLVVGLLLANVGTYFDINIFVIPFWIVAGLLARFPTLYHETEHETE